MISGKESAGLAKHLFGRALATYAVPANSLIVHQDRGSPPLTAHSLTDLLAEMDMARISCGLCTAPSGAGQAG